MAAINLGSSNSAGGVAGGAAGGSKGDSKVDAVNNPAGSETGNTANKAGVRRRATFNTLKVADVNHLTDSSVEVTFEIPEELQESYDYAAGQYLALRAHFDGEEVRRSYSICRPPTKGRISVAVKRDIGGLFSNWVNDNLKAGDEIDVMTPQGTFTSGIEKLDHSHVVGIAAGSGITPVITMANRVLSLSDSSRFDLIYTNKSTLDVMFVEELADLKDRYPQRFALHHILSREQRSAPLMSGRLDEEKLRHFFTTIIPSARVDEWVLCGPFDLVQLTKDLLAEMGVESSQVRFELFATGEPGAEAPRARNIEIKEGEKTYRIDFTLDGTSGSVESPISANESVLNAALRVRSDVPFACSGGVCGTCRARVIEGSVNMAENYALEKDELEKGYILTCQSRPTSDHIVIDYDA